MREKQLTYISIASFSVRSLGWSLAIFVLLLLLAPPTKAQERLTYLVEYSANHAGLLHVVIQSPGTMKGPVTLVIPRAIPSGYVQQFYDRYVEDVAGRATDGTVLRTEREDGPRWRVGSDNNKIKSIEYNVDLARLEREILSASDTSKARADYVGLLGYSVFGYLEGFDNIPIRLEVSAPEGWPVFTTLAPKAPADTSKIVAVAKNFYALADSQVAMGPKLRVQQLDSQIPLFLLSYAEVDTNLNKQGEIFADAFRKVLAYFGDAPFDHYTAYIEILKPLSPQHEYGFSMEHLESSTYFLGVDRAITASTTLQQIERDRFNFAHHVSHSWIPKQVYGTGYLPFTWELAPQIDTIWFNEGFARYIALEALADSMPEAQGENLRQRQLDSLRKTLATMPEFIRSMPLLELSRVGSLMYSDDFRVGRTLFTKGALMAAEIDQKIRERTKGKKRLRDSLRAMVKWGQQSHRPFRTDELPGLIAAPVGISESEIKAIMNQWLAAGK
jgi:predicted metalloprotease with PDZ domain